MRKVVLVAGIVFMFYGQGFAVTELDLPDLGGNNTTTESTPVPTAAASALTPVPPVNTNEPTAVPFVVVTEAPTVEATQMPTIEATAVSTVTATEIPTAKPTEMPTVIPTPTATPTTEMEVPTEEPTAAPTEEATEEATTTLVSEKVKSSEDRLSVLEQYGFLASKHFDSDGVIASAVDNEKTIFSKDDQAIVELKPNVSVLEGESFIVYKEVKDVVNPKGSKDAGVLVLSLGAGVIDKLQGRRAVVTFTRSIEHLDIGYKIAFSGSWRSDEANSSLKNVRLTGTMVAAWRDTDVLGAGDIVFIDLGSNDGLLANDLLRILQSVATGDTTDSTMIVVGGVKVLATLPNTCVGEIAWSKREIKKGFTVERITK